MTRPLTTKGSGQADFTRTVANMDSVQRRLGTIDRSLHGTLPIKVMAGTIEALVGTVQYMRRLGTVGRMGTVPQVTYIPRLGTIGVGGGKGTIEYVRRMGTVGRMGTVAQVAYIPRLGTLGEGGGRGTIGYVRRLGTVGRMGSVPYLGRLGTVVYVPRVGTIGRMGTTQVNFAAQDIMVGVDVQARFMSPVTLRDRSRLGQGGSMYVGSWQHVGSYERKLFTFWFRTGGGSVVVVAGMLGTGVSGGTGSIWPGAKYAAVGAGSMGTVALTAPVRYMRPIVRSRGGGGTFSVFLGRQA